MQEHVIIHVYRIIFFHISSLFQSLQNNFPCLFYSPCLSCVLYVLTNNYLKGSKRKISTINLENQIKFWLEPWNVCFTQALDKYLFLLKWRNSILDSKIWLVFYLLKHFHSGGNLFCQLYSLISSSLQSLKLQYSECEDILS